MRVLFDTNVILDIALKRTPFFDDSSQLFTLIDTGKISASITATTVTDIYYIARSEKNHEETIEFISNLIEVVDVIGVDREVIAKALKSGMKDFEDAIQVTAAEFNRVDCVATRNKNDFIKSGLTIYSPKELNEIFS